ncbi:sensor histidine kinase [Nocardioides sp. URHA0020]|uniref:sensor histidine kinase n=1 Tax=Nocardioides sp. URHA0020 TaxID=1380392 RepID=UPI00068449BF|nr:histidine kinase [Nocardioides sp. URHA0020]
MPARSPGSRRLVVALGCWVLSAGALLLLPVLSESDRGTQLPAVGSFGWWVGAALLTAQAGLLVRAWQAPRAVLVAVAAAAPLAALAGLDDATSLTSLAVMVATYVAATCRPVAALWPALVAAAVLVAAGGLISGAATDAPASELVGGSLLQALGSVGLALLVATIVNARRDVRQARERQVEALEREQVALVQAAIARERTAMARELHDIAAHHLSGIAVMTAAIATQIDADPAAAKIAVGQVRKESTEVLRDLRSLVGLLREDQAPGETRPEDLQGVAALVGDRVAAGQPVDLAVLHGPGDPAHGVGPLAQLAAYRMVQEALANAARHAPGATVHVLVDERAPDVVRVTVDNGPGGPGDTDPGSGFGLVGMRERAELTGSTLEAGPTDDGGWRVSLALPRDDPAEEDR